MSEDGTPAGVVVVLSWFGKTDTLACVESLLAAPLPASILVVDNGSFDGCLEAVAERWPQVSTLQTGGNLGFAGGMNRGVAWALDRGASFVTVLNNDTLVHTDTIARLQAAAVTGAAVNPQIYYRDRPNEPWFGGGTIEEPAAFPRHQRPEEWAAAVDGKRPTDLLTGCCITASATTWRAVGFFDERFFLNFEDSEWSVRARRTGVELLVATEATMLHAVSASFARSPGSLGTFYYVRNGLLFGRTYGNTLRARSAFVRVRGRQALAREWRAGGFRSATVAAIEVSWAVLAHAARRYGRAPRCLQRLARGLSPASGGLGTPG